MEGKEVLSEIKDVVKGDPFHPPRAGSSPESEGFTIPLRGESGSGKTVFLGVNLSTPRPEGRGLPLGLS